MDVRQKSHADGGHQNVPVAIVGMMRIRKKIARENFRFYAIWIPKLDFCSVGKIAPHKMAGIRHGWHSYSLFQYLYFPMIGSEVVDFFRGKWI